MGKSIPILKTIGKGAFLDGLLNLEGGPSFNVPIANPVREGVEATMRQLGLQTGNSSTMNAASGLATFLVTHYISNKASKNGYNDPVMGFRL